jgi:hypothetical protein
MKESEIEKILVQNVKRVGGRAYKFVSPGNDGVPDRLVLLPYGRAVFAELKTETGKLSDLQRMQLKRIRALGQETAVIRGIDGVSRFFHDYGYPDIAKKLNDKYGGKQ